MKAQKWIIRLINTIAIFLNLLHLIISVYSLMNDEVFIYIYKDEFEKSIEPTIKITFLKII